MMHRWSPDYREAIAWWLLNHGENLVPINQGTLVRSELWVALAVLGAGGFIDTKTYPSKALQRHKINQKALDYLCHADNPAT